MSTFIPFMGLVGGLMAVIGWQWRKITESERSMCIGLSAAIVTGTAVGISANELAFLPFLTVLATIAVLDVGLWEWRRTVPVPA